MTGIAGSFPKSPIQSIATFQVSATHCQERKFNLTAIIVPKVTCDLPITPIPFDLTWNHISDIPLADPTFGHIDILLGVDIFADVLLQGRRTGPPGSPVALETKFGWVLSGSTRSTNSPDQINLQATTFHVSAISGDDILRKFWEVEESPDDSPVLSLEECAVVCHFEANHHCTKEGRFMVPLPKKLDAKPIGESRSQAVRRFLSLERSLNSKAQFREVNTGIL